MGGLDILVNNAGLTRDGLAVRMKDEDFQLVLRVNLEAAFRLSRAALKGMMRQRFGRIVGITSVVGVTGNAGQANYAASKAGMIGMSKALAQEVASRGITVNCVAPGFIQSAMTDALDEKQARGDPRQHPRPPARGGRRRGRGGRLSGERRGRLRHRPDHPCERRDGDDLKRPENRPGRGGFPLLVKPHETC